MIYAVNKRTKEHRVVTWQDNDFVDMGWDLVEADADGWIEWVATEDSESPINEDTPYEAMLRDNRISAGVYRWDNIPLRESQVIAYRPYSVARRKT